MEEGSAGGECGNGSNGGGSRWNPTKEQIKTLEGLYKQGLRTPSAQQIQHITARLREHGHIEGKNVFYWFQNHKARQRQKLKLITTTNHDHLYYNHHRVIHPTPPFHHVVCYNNNMPPPPPPKNNIDTAGFYQQYPRVQLPTAAGGGNFKRPRQSSNHHQEQQQTLDLFPMHPTGVLRSKNGINGTENEAAGKQSVKFNTSTSSQHDNDCDKAGQHHHFFDFFC